MDEKEKKQEMCVPAESSGTSPTFEWCGLYNKKNRKEPAATLEKLKRHVILRTQSSQKTTNESLTTCSKK